MTEVTPAVSTNKGILDEAGKGQNRRGGHFDAILSCECIEYAGGGAILNIIFSACFVLVTRRLCRSPTAPPTDGKRRAAETYRCALAVSIQRSVYFLTTSSTCLSEALVPPPPFPHIIPLFLARLLSCSLKSTSVEHTQSLGPPCRHLQWHTQVELI